MFSAHWEFFLSIFGRYIIIRSPYKLGFTSILSASTLLVNYSSSRSTYNEIDRKIDVTAILFLLVQNRHQTHD